jgi:molecular chaperone GrpE
MMSDEKKHVEKDVAPKKRYLAKIQKLEAEIEKLKAESAEWHNKYMRVLADMDNARKQNAKDQQYYIKYRAVPFIEKLLPALDIFNHVIREEQEDPVLNNYLTGFRFVYGQLLDALTSEGLEEVVVNVGDKFDENSMHAVEVKYSEEVEPNTVLGVRNNTFKFIDRLIRPAQVIVSTNIKEEPKNDDNVPEVNPEDLN